MHKMNECTITGDSCVAAEADGDDVPTSPSHVCPLCLSLGIRDPVMLHADFEETESQRTVYACIACRRCVELWRKRLVHASSDSCPVCNSHVPAVPAEGTELAPFDQDPRCQPAHYPALQIKKRSTSSSALAPTFSVCVRNATWGDGSHGNATSGQACTNEPCGICEEAAGVWECLNCGFPLCDACRQSSHAVGRFKTHEVVPAGAPSQSKGRFCAEHPKQNLCLYCTTCETAYCVTCGLADHRKGHMLDELTKASSEFKEDLGKRLSALQHSLHHVSDCAASISASLPTVEAKRNAVKADVTAFFEELRCVINTREGELLEDVDRMFSGRFAEFESRKTTLNRLDAELEAVAGSVNGSLCTAHDVDIMALRKVVKTRLADLNERVNAGDALFRDQDATSFFSTLESVAFSREIGVAPNRGRSSAGNVNDRELLELLRSSGRVSDPVSATKVVPKRPRTASASTDVASASTTTTPLPVPVASALTDSRVKGAVSSPSQSRSPNLQAPHVQPVASPTKYSSVSGGAYALNLPSNLPPVSNHKRFLDLKDPTALVDEDLAPQRKSAQRAAGATLGTNPFATAADYVAGARRGTGNTAPQQPPSAATGGFHLRI